MRRTKRRVSTVLFAAVALLLMSAMTAFACTNLATLNLSESAGAPGSTLDVTGSSFRTGEGVQPVEIRWNGVDGEVLAEVEPDSTGAISTSVTTPDDAQPGYHVLVATQMQENDEGELSPAYGTPARASFLIGAVQEPAEISEPAGVPAGASADAGAPTGLIALTALLALAGIGLFGAGLGLFVRETRRRGAEQPAPVRGE